jgi:hypothetical protein
VCADSYTMAMDTSRRGFPGLSPTTLTAASPALPVHELRSVQRSIMGVGARHMNLAKVVGGSDIDRRTSLGI